MEIKEQLENIQEKLEVIIDDREFIRYNRSVKWQESEKCDKYQSKTEILTKVVDSIATAIELFDEEKGKLI